MKQARQNDRDSRLLIGYGASSMQGVGDPEGGFFKRLDRILRDTGQPRELLNLGVGGWNTDDMIEGLPRVPADRPYEVIVLLGCNDLPRAHDGNPSKRLPLPVHQSNVKALLTALRAEHSLFVSSFLVAQEKTGISPTVFADFVASDLETAKSLGYEILDLYRETKENLTPLLAGDGLHFNATGHALIAGRVATFVKKWTT